MARRPIKSVSWW